MSKIEVNQISSQCGSTLTIGQSGDTIQLACGATQTGFGRTGTVDWDTTAKTASFTAVSGNGYFVNTTSGTITVTMPASPSAGDIVGIKDYAGTFGTNGVTISRNGSNFDGIETDPVLVTNQLSVLFVYVDGTQGWKSTQSDSADYGISFITATGGTITCCGDFRIHTFTSPGTFSVLGLSNVPTNNDVDYLVVAGGGGGGGFGGGGAGGYRESDGTATGCYSVSPLGACVSALPVSVSPYPISVGSGGAGSAAPQLEGTDGSNSVFSTITSAGGGGGGAFGPPGESLGRNGGSGGGGGALNTPPYPGQAGGTGNTPPVSPPQGNNGGTGQPGGNAGGGAGGASASGGNASSTVGGNGGNGVATSISSSSVTRAGGGGGAGSGTRGIGGSGGGGNGENDSSPTEPAEAGTINTGGGGGGSYVDSGASGGSGIVIIRYRYQ